MKTRRFVPLFLCMLAASLAAGLPLMHRSQTVISIPEPGVQVPLYALSYKANAFEAKVTAVTLKIESAADADPVVGEWTFLASNSDGQLHKVDIYTRLLDETGKQLAMESRKCMPGGGSHDVVCTVPLKVKAADWKAIKSVRIVTDWLS
jgi:hypothetical protein